MAGKVNNYQGEIQKQMLSIIHVNAQSLLCNFNEVELLMNNKEIDILCISETWLTSEILDSYIDIQGFNVFRNDKGRGGGVCMYVRDDLNITKFLPEQHHMKG